MFDRFKRINKFSLAGEIETPLVVEAIGKANHLCGNSSALYCLWWTYAIISGGRENIQRSQNA